MVLRIAAVFFAVLASYWCGRSQTWEPFFASAGFLLTYLGAETYNHYKSQDKLTADRALFVQFTNELPFVGAISFLKDHDLRVVFRPSKLADLHRFLEKWANPGRKFHDRQIERAMANLRTTANGFLDDLAVNTWPREVEDLQEIPKEWERNEPSRYEEVSSRLNRRALEVVKQYEQLVQVAQARLRV
jgi:hypothetical protein